MKKIVNGVEVDLTEAEIAAIEVDRATFNARPVNVAHVKAEAHRRIVSILPEWKQRNMTAEAAILAKIGEANWTDEQRAKWDAGEAIWSIVTAIRAASDAIEAMNPIPKNFKDDGYWP